MFELYRLDSFFAPAVWSATGILFFFLLEYIIPFRPSTLSKFRRWRINFSLVFINIVLVDLCFVFLLNQIRLFSGEYNLDILNSLQLSSFWRIVITVLIFDLVTYYWHRLNHEVPFFWRFHQVHHSDRNIDVSSAARFHFIELTISMVITYFVMLILGASIVEVRIFQVVLMLTAQFCHSNLKIWEPLDRVLWWVVVPPSMHRIHHSDERRFTDSNYGTFLSIWDRLFGTLRNDIAQENIVFGLKQYTDEQKLMFNKLVVMPFKNNSRKE